MNTSDNVREFIRAYRCQVGALGNLPQEAQIRILTNGLVASLDLMEIMQDLADEQEQSRLAALDIVNDIKRKMDADQTAFDLPAYLHRQAE